MSSDHETAAGWPELPVGDWIPSLATLHLFTQVVGKIRMACMPWINHSWSVPLYVTSRGLGTSLVPHGTEGFSLDFDLLGDELVLATTTGRRESIALARQTVASFHREVLERMEAVGMPVRIHPMPSEIPDAIPLPEDEVHRHYDHEHAVSLWRALVQVHRVFMRFRAGYQGKASPVHFFWGSFDLAVTRFSGRTAPPHPGGLPHFPDDVAREAYSHEVSSVGFWPGNGEAPTPIFYAYAYPTPERFREAKVSPPAATWHAELGEFVLPYEAVRTARDPDRDLLSFLESAHAAAADLAGWDRASLECAPPFGPDWWRERHAP